MLQIDQILKGCKKQNADCQKLLYQHYYGLMMSICNRYSSSIEDAEEMLNNGFLKIFVNVNQFEGKGSFEGWMKKIMINSCLDFIKSKQTKLGKLTSNPNNIDNESAFFDNSLFKQGEFVEIELEQKWAKDELWAFLNHLPEPTKTVFNLSVFEEYTHKEISVLLNMAERTSQWHLSNARKILGELILKKNNYKKAVGL
jgi:RNA polymerase sigma-70 factor (ECF subfamily)